MEDKLNILKKIKPLPNYLQQRYNGWKSTIHVENKVWYRRLAEEGQRPRCMVISCCDSRVQVTEVFGAGPGEFFMHRNIANLVPPYAPDSDHHGTSAAVEYAVTTLKISNLIIMGHSVCGGVAGCQDMCNGNAPELDSPDSFLGRWLDILRPGFERVKDITDAQAQTTALEKEAIVVSLENLMTFPFVIKAVDEDQLVLHGIWMNIANGDLEILEPETRKFASL